MREVFIGQVDLVVRARPLDWRFGRLAARLFSARLRLRLTRRELGFVLRLLARMAFLGSRLDLRPHLGQLAQTLLAPRQFVRYRHAVGNVRLVRRFGFGHQIGDLGFQLRLDLAGMLMRQPRCAGWRWRGSSYRPAPPSPFSERPSPARAAALERTELRSPRESAAEGRDRVVVGMIVGRDEPECHRVIGRTLQLAARKHARRIAVNQKAQQHSRMIRRRPGTAISAAHRAKIEPLDNLHDKSRQMFFGKPFVDRGRQQEPRRAIDRAKIGSSKAPAALRESTPVSSAIAGAGIDPRGMLGGSPTGAAPPHTRGWTLYARRNICWIIGSPAHAGMDPPEGISQAATTGLPRTRGDGPAMDFLKHGDITAPPHTRGWTRNGFLKLAESTGSPAHAGMDPQWISSSTGTLRLPRTRGDGPEVGQRDELLAEFR